MVDTRPQDLQGLEPSFRNQVERWLAAGGGAFGIGAGGGLRSHQRQIELRRINGCPDIWTSSPSSCRVPTAIPGTSRHEKGQAVDIVGDYALAKKLAPLYGLTDISREPWHFQSTNPSRNTSVYAGGSVQLNRQPQDGAASSDSDCLIRMPSFSAGAGSLPVIGPVIDLLPGDQSVTVGGQCLFTRSNARGLLGAICLVGGVGIIALGLQLVTKISVVGASQRMQQVPGGWRQIAEA